MVSKNFETKPLVIEQKSPMKIEVNAYMPVVKKVNAVAAKKSTHALPKDILKVEEKATTQNYSSKNHFVNGAKETIMHQTYNN